jgi:photosystem II stability/assembly factor-like uncharacterized protein
MSGRTLRKRTTISTVLSVAALVAVVLTLPHPADAPTPARESGSGAFDVESSLGPEDSYLFTRSVGGGQPSLADFAAVGRERADVLAATKAEAPALLDRRWRFQGPTNIGGRVVDLALDPKHVGTVYVATAGGGVWRTKDRGKSFAPIWPRRLPQAIGAIATGPDGTIYVGTGETNPGGGSITYGGDGIYRSTDHGRTWRHFGLRHSSTIARLVVDPRNPHRVYAAVSGNLYIPGGQRGLYVSTDKARHWHRLLKPPNGTTGASDVAVDPKNPRHLFVGMWDHIRHPDVRTYTGVGSGLWRSNNAGQTWKRLGPEEGLLADSKANGRVGVTVDPTHPKNVYMIYANDPLGLFEAFYVSRDGGDSWTAPEQAQSDLADSQYVYGWWFAHLWVDPWQPSHVFVAGLDLYQSTDRGESFSISQGPHADQHAMAFDPRVRKLVYLGDDGGFYRSTTGGTSQSWIKATYEPWTQFDGLDVSEQDPTRINGGLQDNGSVRSWGPDGGGTDGWSDYYGGDGQQNLINPKNKNNVFACYQYGACAVSTDGGESMNEFDQQTVSDRHNYFTPMAFDPSNPSTVFYAGDVVNQSLDGGQTWAPISQDLGNLDPGTEINPLYAAHYGTVTTLAVGAESTGAQGATDAGLIWAGTDNGLLWKTTTAGPVWTQITAPELPTRWVTHVTIDPTDADTVYVTYSGFRAGIHTPYVFRTTDGGAHWKSITANLPKAPVNDIAVIGSRLYVASDVGVYTSKVADIRWHVLGTRLPNAPVTHLRYVASNDRLYVSTFGRCVWSVSLA